MLSGWHKCLSLREMEILANNWAEILLALITAADVIVSATPTKKDDRALGYLRIIVQTIAGKKKTK